ncbi:MAG: heparinase II/III family protein [Planctomycetota bacterium]
MTARNRVVAMVVMTMSLLHAEADVFAQPLNDLKLDRPRLIATADRFAALRERRSQDTVLNEILDQIERRAGVFLDEPVLERKQVGRRLLGVSREAFERITLLAVAFHTTGNPEYARRAEAELLGVAAFSDWNPSHFLDTAEMAAAVGLGYDWLYQELDDDRRQILRTALLDKALVLEETPGVYYWKTRSNNWNAVCFGGMLIGALAIAEDEPEVALRWIASAQRDNPLALHEYAPDGVYPEGPSYWAYGTTYQVLLIETLRSAIGDDLGLAEAPGFIESGGFMTHACGPSGKAYNFADGRSNVVYTPAVLWTARESGRSEWLVPWQRGGWRSVLQDRGRFTAFSALWWLDTAAPDGAATPALSWIGHGKNPVAFFRESWSDPNTMYLGLKGGRANVSHGHMDAGSFVYEANGVRWAIDLGMAPYHPLEAAGVQLWDRNQDSDRWRVYQYRNETHNTLTVNDETMLVTADAAITGFEPFDERNGRGWARVDLTESLGLMVESAEREFVFRTAGHRGIEIKDTLQLVPGAQVAWTLMTAAEVEWLADAKWVQLRQDGKTLSVEFVGEAPGMWVAEPYRIPEGFFGPERPEVTRLQWRGVADEAGRLDLRVVLQPGAVDG